MRPPSAVTLIAWWFAVTCSTGPGLAAGKAASAKSGRTTSSSALHETRVETCPSRTINYITHTLPQQCWRTSWEATTVTEGAANDTVITAPSATEEKSDAILPKASTTDASNEAPEIYKDDKSTSRPAGDIFASTTGTTNSVTSKSTTSVDTSTSPESASPLDESEFLSFEEWKKVNLAKSGQSSDSVGQKNMQRQQDQKMRQAAAMNNALDTMGEDGEIELDFGGFMQASPSESEQTEYGIRKDNREENSASGAGAEGVAATVRNIDAGKTCKERFNFASLDCAATILKTNPEAKSSMAILGENKDNYMLNKCSADNKFIIVEMCNDILIDTVVLANFEYFSSMFWEFRLSVSARYPVKMDKWKTLGVYEARNTRSIQAFLVEQPLIWARYLRIEFLSHFGNEYYCPVSLLRVHGTTMMDEYRHQEYAAREDEITIEEVAGDVVQAIEGARNGAAMEKSDAETAPDTKQQEVQVAEAGSKATAEVNASSDLVPQNGLQTSENDVDHGDTSTNDTMTDFNAMSSSSRQTATCPALPFPSPVLYRGDDEDQHDASTCKREATNHSTSNEHQQATTGSSNLKRVLITPPPTVSTAVPTASLGSQNTTESSNSTQKLGTIIGNSTEIPTLKNSTHHSNKTSTISSATISQGRTSSNSSSPSIIKSVAPASSQPTPATQESFFKSVQKRLQQLESNATLSLQYIEEQSRLLRDAFAKVEKRQVTRTETFLAALNETVVAEMVTFRTQYDHLWQSTVIELEAQRERYEHEVVAIGRRMTVMADELLFQKRMAIVQSTVILLCLGLVLFAKSTGSSSSHLLEEPALVLQQMMHKGHLALKMPFESPLESPSSTRAPSRSRWPRWRSPVKDRSLADEYDVTNTPEHHRHVYRHARPVSTSASDPDHDHDENEPISSPNSPHPFVEPALVRADTAPAAPIATVEDVSLPNHVNNDNDDDDDETENDEEDIPAFLTAAPSPATMPLAPTLEALRFPAETQSSPTTPLKGGEEKRLGHRS